jgi:DNA-binding transcriptional ArsR family regulator
MVYYSGRGLDHTFAALADPTRRAMLARLTLGEASVTELARPFAISLPAVSKHLGVLERAGLVVRSKQGRVRRCRLVARPLDQAARWIERYRRFWEHQLGRLERYLRDTQQEEASWPPSNRPPSPFGSPALSGRRPRKSSGRGRRPKR